MRAKITLLFFSVILTASAYCQTDSIYLHSGAVIGGHIKEVLRYAITYTFEGVKAVKVVSKRAVQKIVYGSGSREEAISPFMSINSEADWEKVIVLDDIAETAGLVYAGDVAGRGGGKFVDSSQAERESMTLLRKGAARLRCPFVYIADNSLRHTGYVGRRVRKSGVAYKY